MASAATYTFTAVTSFTGKPFVVWSYGEGDDPEVLCEVEDAEFAEHIAKYDPTHAGLMEDVVQAARSRHEVWTRETYIGINDALNALDTYRKERGLDE